MKTGMTNFNVNMYNEKIELLNEIIDTLNNTIYSFYSWGHTITPAFVKKLIDNPAEIYHEYLSFEYIAQRKCAEHGIKTKNIFILYTKTVSMILWMKWNPYLNLLINSAGYYHISKKFMVLYAIL